MSEQCPNNQEVAEKLFPWELERSLGSHNLAVSFSPDADDHDRGEFVVTLTVRRRSIEMSYGAADAEALFSREPGPASLPPCEECGHTVALLRQTVDRFATVAPDEQDRARVEDSSSTEDFDDATCLRCGADVASVGELQEALLTHVFGPEGGTP